MFHVGQQVVCVDASPPDFWWPDMENEWLVKNKIYTIAAIYPRKDGAMLVRLASVADEIYPYNGWRANRFRPLVERKTDISVFIKLLTPTKEKADV